MTVIMFVTWPKCLSMLTFAVMEIKDILRICVVHVSTFV